MPISLELHPKAILALPVHKTSRNNKKEPTPMFACGLILFKLFAVHQNALTLNFAPGVADLKNNQGKKLENKFHTDFKLNCVYWGTQQ